MHLMFLEMSFTVTETKHNEDLRTAERTYYSLVIIIKSQFWFWVFFLLSFAFLKNV